MSTATTRPQSRDVRLTRFPRSRRAETDQHVDVLHEGAREAREARKRQIDAQKAQKGYEAAECCTYAAETIVEAGHAGKAGVLLGIATNILIRSRYQAVTGETPGSTPSKLVTKMRNNLAFDPTEVDWLADALGGSATTSLAGLSRVVETLRDILDGLTSEGESE